MPEASQNIDGAIAESEQPLSLESFDKILTRVCKDANLPENLFSKSAWSHRKLQYRKKDGKFPPLEPQTELMSSFYLKDIACIKKNPGNQVKRYAEAKLEESPARVMIDSDIRSMQKWFEADRFPKGTWPSVHSPSLMQQLAINLAGSQQKIFSVNGPPGTGKTTLLKEVIASNIVERAILMAQYEKPDNAFQKHEFKTPPDQYNRTYYSPDKALTDYGMLVASNNNAAVENISIELPKAIDKDRSGRFSGSDDVPATYFGDIATDLLGEPAWGLISARLGKKKNLDELKERLWWSKESVTLKKYYDQSEALPDWEAAKKDFLCALEAVKLERDSVNEVQKLYQQYTEIQEARHTEEFKLEDLRAKLEDQIQQRDKQAVLLKNLEDAYTLQEQNIALLKSRLTLLKRLFPGFFKNDAIVQEWVNLKLLNEQTLVNITRQRTDLYKYNALQDDTKLKIEQQTADLFDLSQKKSNLETELEPQRKRFGSNFANHDFWQNIHLNENSQVACPWTNDSYNTLREELFYRALMLQKAFVLNSNGVKQNIQRLFKMWDGGFALEDRAAAYAALLNTLFFVVPVISTTFASVQKFLGGIQADELGILVIDEAGQATPQSALGTLWRTRKAIVVGDPLQVEPIMATPLELYKRFAQDYAVPSVYRLPELSVQMLADAQNPFGGTRKTNDETLWLGCPLVVHRRCIEPMFSMSNDLAYNGRMFCKTKTPSKDTNFLLEQSAWFDIDGVEIGNKNHTVPDQIEFVASLIKKAVLQHNGLPEIYIITPFVSIKRALDIELKLLFRGLLPNIQQETINNWMNENCGTIHTFQGREANEVLIVLGCDQQQGVGAARWVGQKPNIINVAASRAKFRVGVIGSYALWSNIPYVEVVCRMLKHTLSER